MSLLVIICCMCYWQKKDNWLNKNWRVKKYTNSQYFLEKYHRHISIKCEWHSKWLNPCCWSEGMHKMNSLKYFKNKWRIEVHYKMWKFYLLFFFRGHTEFKFQFTAYFIFICIGWSNINAFLRKTNATGWWVCTYLIAYHEE